MTEPANPFEASEDTCDVVKEDGTVCGAHIGYGVRFLHLRVCDEHRGEDTEEGADE